MLEQLTAVVGIEDAATGTVKVKANAKDNRDATLRLEAASIRTTVNKGAK